MKKLFIFFTSFIIIFLVLFSQTANASSSIDTSIRIVDSKKIWTVTFNEQIEFDAISKKAFYILDDTGNLVNNIFTLSKDERTIVVEPPAEGYAPGKTYSLNIGTGIHSKSGKNLKEILKIIFSIRTSIIDSIIILPETDYDKTEAQAMVDRLGKISAKILQKLSNEGVKIKLINGHITDEPEYSNLIGITPKGWEGTGKTWDDIPGVGGNPTVVRIGYSEPSTDHGHGAVNLELHETAHAVDWYIEDSSLYGRISKSENYISLWKKEAKILFGNNSYFNNYSEEYFAETFAMFYLNQETNNVLKTIAPLTYSFLKHLDETGSIFDGVGYMISKRQTVSFKTSRLFILPYLL